MIRVYIDKYVIHIRVINNNNFVRVNKTYIQFVTVSLHWPVNTPFNPCLLNISTNNIDRKLKK